jgi:hypothetical protein
MKTAYATIKGFEAMRALRKGQAAIFNLTRDIVGEARLIERAFGLGPCTLTEAVQLVGERLEARVSASTTSRKSIMRYSRKFATEPFWIAIHWSRNGQHRFTRVCPVPGSEQCDRDGAEVGGRTYASRVVALSPLLCPQADSSCRKFDRIAARCSRETFRGIAFEVQR